MFRKSCEVEERNVEGESSSRKEGRSCKEEEGGGGGIDLTVTTPRSEPRLPL